MEQPKTIDEILSDLYWESQHDNDNNEYWQGHIKETKQALADLLLGLSSLQDKKGVQKGSPEWRNRTLCIECRYPYMAELGGCICVADDEIRYVIRDEIAEVLGVSLGNKP